MDKQIKKSLIKETDYPAHHKEDIWNQIQQEIDTDKSNITSDTPRKRNWKKVSAITSIAATLFIVFTMTTTETGNAFVNKIKELFVPEKVVTEELEGMEEENQVSLQEGKVGYVIYFDKENYKMIEVEGRDRIVFKQELSDMYPEVYMEIYQLDENPKILAEKMQDQLKSEYPSVLEIEEVKDPIESLMVHAVGGTGGLEWDDPVIRYYYFSNEQGGSFVVKQQYFIEASEGHGARFDHMLSEFYIVENKQ